jgi:hypothetical protein
MSLYSFVREEFFQYYAAGMLFTLLDQSKITINTGFNNDLVYTYNCYLTAQDDIFSQLTISYSDIRIVVFSEVENYRYDSSCYSYVIEDCRTLRFGYNGPYLNLQTELSYIADSNEQLQFPMSVLASTLNYDYCNMRYFRYKNNVVIESNIISEYSSIHNFTTNYKYYFYTPIPPLSISKETIDFPRTTEFRARNLAVN